MDCAAIGVVERLVISGGSLGNTSWVPKEIKLVDGGLKFIALRASDSNFVRFLGATGATRSPLQDNSFIELLKTQRDDLVDALVLSHLKANDPMLQKLPRHARRQVDQCDVASFVEWEGPPISATEKCSLEAPETKIKLFTELDRKRVVSIEATPAVLMYVRAAAMHAHLTGEASNARKRAQPIGVPGFRWDKRSNRVYTYVEDPTNPNVKTRVSLKLQSNDIEGTAQELKQHIYQMSMDQEYQLDKDESSMHDSAPTDDGDEAGEVSTS